MTFDSAQQPGDDNYPLAKLKANYSALSPLSFIARSADIYPEQTAIRYGSLTRDWSTTYKRCRQCASKLVDLGVKPGDVVSVIAPNIPELYELHFAAPMCGAILNAINTRLEAKTIRYILEHGEAKVCFVDKESTLLVNEAMANLSDTPTLITIDDPNASGEPIADLDYERFIATGNAEFDWHLPDDEWQSISLNYTSGTTGDPKGVVYHHRGAYLNALSNIVGWEMGKHPVYLWTLPMFHCNGWCFPWSLAAVAGTSICTRSVTASAIYESIDQYGVTHLCGAPIVLNFIINADPTDIKNLPHTVEVMTAAAPPPASVLERVESLGFHVTHVYGLTETYGPAVMCAWKSEWDELPPADRAHMKSRQGVRYHVLEGLDVKDPETMLSTPSDGKTIGEVMFQGNIVMRGYFKNEKANCEAFKDGWFHSGDLAVKDEDGYLRILDRSKDIIISGGENISSIEIEDVLYTHPDILEAAVAARPDEKWGETPCAFVTLLAGKSASEEDIINYCRDRLAHFKCPKTIIFTELPKTSTGKVQKFQLREWAKQLDT